MSLLPEIAKLSHVFIGEDYITFEVAKLKAPDSYGHGFTAYVNKMVENPEEASRVEDSPQKTTTKTKKPNQHNGHKVDAKGKIVPDMVPTGNIPF